MKLSKKDKKKILARYHNKLAEYSLKTRDEIKELLEKLGKKELKISYTDTKALWDAASVVMQRERQANLEQLEQGKEEQQISNNELTTQKSEEIGGQQPENSIEQE